MGWGAKQTRTAHKVLQNISHRDLRSKRSSANICSNSKELGVDSWVFIMLCIMFHPHFYFYMASTFPSISVFICSSTDNTVSALKDRDLKQLCPLLALKEMHLY